MSARDAVITAAVRWAVSGGDVGLQNEFLSALDAFEAEVLERAAKVAGRSFSAEHAEQSIRALATAPQAPSAKEQSNDQ